MIHHRGEEAHLRTLRSHFRLETRLRSIVSGSNAAGVAHSSALKCRRKRFVLVRRRPNPQRNHVRPDRNPVGGVALIDRALVCDREPKPNGPSSYHRASATLKLPTNLRQRRIGSFSQGRGPENLRDGKRSDAPVTGIVISRKAKQDDVHIRSGKNVGWFLSYRGISEYLTSCVIKAKSLEELPRFPQFRSREGTVDRQSSRCCLSKDAARRRIRR